MSKDYRIQVRVNAVLVRLPIYRIWIDDELMCERTYWPNPQEYSIVETIIASLEHEKTYVLKFELVDPSLGKAWMDHVTITDVELDWLCQDHAIGSMQNNLQELKFTI